MNVRALFLQLNVGPPLNAITIRHSVAVLLAIFVAWSQYVVPARGSLAPTPHPGFVAPVAALIRQIPDRSADALTGSQFAKSVQGMDTRERERAVLRELLHGNMPTFLRRLVPVTLTAPSGRAKAATVFVMPDYLAIGSDVDFLRIPMNLETASTIAAQFGFLLPTRRIVNAVYDQSAHHFVPEPLPAGPQMSSTEYYRHHNELIDAQSRSMGVVPGTLVSGHKKDVVVTNLLARIPGRIAIYGWQRPGGIPIQPLSTVHGACYEDYSHGIRLVSEIAWEDGALRPVRDILQDAVEARVLSDEGPIRSVFDRAGQPTAALTTFAPGLCSSGTRTGN